MNRPLTHRYGCRGAALATSPGPAPGLTQLRCRNCGALGIAHNDLERRRPRPHVDRDTEPSLPPGIAAYLATQTDDERPDR